MINIKLSSVDCPLYSVCLYTCLIIAHTCIRTTEDDDFVEVKEAVHDVLHRWKFVAGALGIRPSQIQTIETTHRGNPEECMDDAIIQWLRRSHNETKHGPPTWRKLVQVIAARAGGENVALASTIAKSHPSQYISTFNSIFI